MSTVWYGRIVLLLTTGLREVSHALLSVLTDLGTLHRQGEVPSDHVPVVADLELSGADDDDDLPMIFG